MSLVILTNTATEPVKPDNGSSDPSSEEQLPCGYYEQEKSQCWWKEDLTDLGSRKMRKSFLKADTPQGWNKPSL